MFERDKYATGKLTPEGEPDPSIFSTEWNKEGIQVGTAIALLVRKEPHTALNEIQFRHFWGRTKKIQLLAAAQEENTLYQQLEPSLELGLPFKPMQFDAAYSQGPLLTELFPTFYPGVQTKRDKLVVDIDLDSLLQQMEQYFDPSISHEQMKHICPCAIEGTTQFDAKPARDYLLKRGFLSQYVVYHCYRPFDVRWLYWEPETGLLGRKVPDYFPQVFDGNIWIVSQHKPRRVWSRPQFVRSIGCLDLMDRGASCIPLFLKPSEDEVLTISQ